MCDKTINITYTIRCPEAADRELTFRVVLDAKTLEEVGRDPGSPPSWTRMDTAQCGVCPLRKEDHPHCPAALALVEVVEKVGDLISYTEVHATVTTRERTFSADTTVQRALSSLIGLRMAACGCPILAKFRPMARFHLPFATLDETLFRSMGAYLLAQFFLNQRGKLAEFGIEGLREIYDQIDAVNVGLAARLRGQVQGDANVNALVTLDLFGQNLPHSLNDNLRCLEDVFAPYYNE